MCVCVDRDTRVSEGITRTTRTSREAPNNTPPHTSPRMPTTMPRHIACLECHVTLHFLFEVGQGPREIELCSMQPRCVYLQSNVVSVHLLPGFGVRRAEALRPRINGGQRQVAITLQILHHSTQPNPTHTTPHHA